MTYEEKQKLALGEMTVGMITDVLAAVTVGGGFAYARRTVAIREGGRVELIIASKEVADRFDAIARNESNVADIQLTPGGEKS